MELDASEIDQFHDGDIPGIFSKGSRKVTSQFKMKIYLSNCLYIDESINEWKHDGCKVSLFIDIVFHKQNLNLKFN